ncbi:MAG: DUF2520 domain-containing protein [Saprospiraceae bacterium]|uniref:DUF2520 domain-containing protein n=1 Tax=Candidatus Opimibacter skivensis TaxID=2982028 RepID=A0A9D7XQB7_9BACT|nr:DUF2520 domain-containing protein [Candidatus Opimibacter skivensis]
MKIVCIGAGRLAHQLMPALEDAGCEIIQVYNRTPEAAKLLSDKLKSASHISKLEEVNPDAEIYFLTVSDDVINPMALELKKIISPEALCVHCSGILELDVIPFNRKAGFYPLQSFSDNHDVSFRFIPIIITTHDDDIWIELDQIAGRMSSSVYRMTDEQKSILHVAAVFANNFSNHMLTIAESICKENQLPFEILKPLILETFSKAILSGPKESQTGPAIRGDEKTIEKHLHLLENNPELVDVYKIVTKSIRITNNE